jgi:hypothetical protein
MRRSADLSRWARADHHCQNARRVASCFRQPALYKTYIEDLRGHSSAGRAPALQAGGRRFDPGWLHSRKYLQICGFEGAYGIRFRRRVPQMSTTSGLILRGISAAAVCRQEVEVRAQHRSSGSPARALVFAFRGGRQGFNLAPFVAARPPSFGSNDCDPRPQKCRLAGQQTIRYNNEGSRMQVLR